MNASLSASLVWRGLFSVVIGLVTIAWPGITIGAVLVLFAVYALLDAMTQLALAFGGSRRRERVAGRILVAILDIAAAVVTIAWPHITALALVVVVGLWAVIAGLAETGAAFTAHVRGGERVLLASAGVLSVLLGIVLLAHPHAGVFALAVVFGLFALFFGFSSLVMGWRMKGIEDEIRSRYAGGAYPDADRGPGVPGRERQERAP